MALLEFFLKEQYYILFSIFLASSQKNLPLFIPNEWKGLFMKCFLKILISYQIIKIFLLKYISKLADLEFKVIKNVLKNVKS
jgi:hypothetical protein